MKKAVLFDLDNTLYPEIEFVRSGFRAVAQYLGSRYNLSENLLVKYMLDVLRRDGRGKIFDTLLHHLGLYSEEKVKLLVYLYRSHWATIHLYEDVLPTLECLRCYGTRLGIITDGMASVQRNKIAALGLNNLFDVIVCTDELGKDCWKPSTIPYKIALELLEVRPSEGVYVGDDPSKDFLAPNSMGMLAIQVNRQTYQNLKHESIPELAAARFVIKGLKQILPIIRGENNVC